jgi:O-antigen/teichoic acid export membrane protein
MAGPDTAAPGDSLGSRIVSGVAWKAISQVTLQASRMIVALILARQLAPHDWGLAAMVFVFSSFLVVFTDSALGTALIQRRALDDADRSTVFWLSTGIGAVLMVGGLAAAGPLADFYGESAVEGLFMAASVGFLVTAAGTTHSALLIRDMKFRRLELRQIAATGVGAIVGITVAFNGGGAWAIIAQVLGEAVVSTILLWILMPWRPSLTFSLASLKKLGGFAGAVFGENVITQAYRTVTSLVIGRVLGAAAIGTWTLANNVILVPFARLAGPLQQVFFPAFSSINDDRERLADLWIRASRVIALVSIPALVGLVIVAPDFVDVALGPEWSETTTLIQILGWVGLFASLQTLNAEILLALGLAGTFFRFTIFQTVVAIVGFAIGLEWGIVGLAVSLLVTTLITEPARLVVTTRALGISVWRFVRPLGGIVQATAIMGVAVFALRSAMVAGDVPTLARLVLAVVAGALVYVPACLWRASDLTAELKGMIQRRRGRTAAPAVVALQPVES